MLQFPTSKHILQNMHRKVEKKIGFTLLEVMVALFLTAIIIATLATAFNTGLRAYRQGKDLIEITRKGQLVLGQMTKELSSAMMGANITFEGNANSIYFMAPIAENSDLDLCEVGYLYNGTGREINRHYLTYGGANGTFEYPNGIVNFSGGSGIRKNFCSNITVFNLRYHNGASWAATWSNTSRLPTMVEASVTIEGKYGSPRQTKTFLTWVYLPYSDN